ncbi:MAG: GvpL/GvpF family gas vesicle protein [Alphaproteobacteria bacterium]
MSAVQIERRSGDPIYVYAIVPSGQSGQSAIAGMEAIAGRLGTIGEGPFSAVVGGALAYDLKGRSREELGRLLLVHQQVTEQLVRVASVLPVKFGTQAPDEMGVREALERGCRLFETVFAELEGCTQLEILITWDLNAVFADIAMEEPIARLKARLAKNTEDVTPAGRAALGGLVKDALERRRAALVGRLSEALRTVAIDTIVHPIVADRIVLHMALLVKTDAVDAVDRCLETLDAEFGGGLSFRCVGPTAPTSFATVEIEFLEADEIEQASRTLEVDSTASPADVRFAYHRLARRVHPDTAGARDDGSGTMAALTKAYKFLSRYARARESERTGNEPLCLDSAAARAVLVSVRRQDAAGGGAAIVGRA